MYNFSAEQEAELFGRYLLKCPPSPFAKDVYAKAIVSSNVVIENKDQKLLQFAMNNPWSIGLIDSGTALLRPNSEVRRRIYVMFAILESMPDFCDIFLPKQRTPFYLFVIFYSGARSVVKALIGSLLVKTIT